MRMSLITTSAFSLVSEARAASQLWTNRGLKPSAVKTSQSNSQVTGSSSTTINLGALSDTTKHLLGRVALAERQGQAKSGAVMVANQEFNLSTMTMRDVPRDRQSETAARALGRP